MNKLRLEHGWPASTVFAYPSVGGLVRKSSITRVELDWLGMTSPTTSNDKNGPIVKMEATKQDDLEEDAFALRLMQLGGRWWKSVLSYSPGDDPFRDQYRTHDHHSPPNLNIGYLPTGEVVVLRTIDGNSSGGEPPEAPGLRPDVPKERLDDWSRLALCSTMEERCDVLRDFGAAVYASAEECPDVPEFLEDGVARGRWYEDVMKKMNDLDHVYMWVEPFEVNRYSAVFSH